MPGPDQRVLFFCRYFPPALTGSAILMGNLLSHFPADSLHVITGRPGRVKIDPSYSLDVPQTHIELPRVIGRLGPRLAFLLYPLALTTALRLHARRRFTAVFASWPPGIDLEFAYRFHRISGAAFYVYMHDMWSETRRTRRARALAVRLERRYLGAAKTVFCITEPAAQHFQRKYGVRSRTLEHSVDWSWIDAADRFVELPRASDGAVWIGFSGAIYRLMNTDSLVRINEAVQQIPNAHLSCSTQILEPAANFGLRGSRVSLHSLSRKEAFQDLQRSTVVCVPLAFESYAPLEVETVFPTKLLDYFVCGRPILVHAPPDSFVARDARAKGWGWVVDRPDIAAVREGIETIIADPSLQRKLVAAAWQEARRRDSRVVARALWRYVLGQ